MSFDNVVCLTTRIGRWGTTTSTSLYVNLLRDHSQPLAANSVHSLLAKQNRTAREETEKFKDAGQMQNQLDPATNTSNALLRDPKMSGTDKPTDPGVDNGANQPVVDSAAVGIANMLLA